MPKLVQPTERERILAFTINNELVRACELRRLGVSGTAIASAVQDGILRKGHRGLYLSQGSSPEMYVELAEISKRYPEHPICLNSALAFYGVTVLLPRAIWIAIPASCWKPQSAKPPVDAVRFREPYYSEGRVTHKIQGVQVTMYSIEKTLADAFRNPKLVRLPVAIESLRNTIEDGLARPLEILRAAKKFGALKKMKPYVEALTTYA